KSHLPLKVAVWPPGGTPNGAMITAYFTDHHIRYQSKTDSSTDSTKYYRPDGTLAYTIELSGGTLTINMFDSTGQKLRLGQMWWKREHGAIKDGARRYWLYSVTEADQDGNTTRQVEFAETGQVASLGLYGTEFNGKHYGFLYRTFRPDG